MKLRRMKTKKLAYGFIKVSGAVAKHGGWKMVFFVRIKCRPYGQPISFGFFGIRRAWNACGRCTLFARTTFTRIERGLLDGAGQWSGRWLWRHRWNRETFRQATPRAVGGAVATKYCARGEYSNAPPPWTVNYNKNPN